MSDLYVRRLERVKDQRQAASGALAYVSLNWYRANLFTFPGLESTGAEDIRRASDDIETTYFIRLFSGFEGILKEHLAVNHSRLHVAEDVSAAWLIDRVAKLQKPPLSDTFRVRVHEVRKYRNFLVHSGSTLPIFIQFADAALSPAP